MSIVESGNSRPSHRITRIEALAGGALVAAAVFAASPKPVHADLQYTGTGGTSTNPASTSVTWFNTSNWSNGGVTGTLPESYPVAGGQVPNIEPNNASMPSVGVVFDPANDPNTPAGTPGGNGNYYANIIPITSTMYIAAIEGATVTGPGKLTVDSGTIIVASASIGRDGSGILALNGGTWINGGGSLKVQASNKNTTLGSGTFEYHGGTFETIQGVQLGSGSTTAGVYKTSAGIGTFVVYNDGADGALLSNNGFQFSANTVSKGTMGIVEFHYDTNPSATVIGEIAPGSLGGGAVGGTRPIQINWNGASAQQSTSEASQGELFMNNGTTSSSRLNFVLDTAPGTIVAASNPQSTYQNLGLFDETVIKTSGTYPHAFYSVAGDSVFTQGATISATYGGNTYSWTISYSGQINFTNTATSAYTSSGIQATGGDDVVLIGITPLFNGVPVPEPTSLALMGGAGSLILARRRQRKSK